MHLPHGEGVISRELLYLSVRSSVQCDTTPQFQQLQEKTRKDYNYIVH